MKVGIIGYGSMGKMILEKFAESGIVQSDELYVANRTFDKVKHLQKLVHVCDSNVDLAQCADIIFICVRPGDIKDILTEIKPVITDNTLLVSLNGSVTFDLMEKVVPNKIAKVIPSVTAEINRSQTLICYNRLINEEDKAVLTRLLSCMGNVIELPEEEIGMGSELVSCMPGFIASIFDVLHQSARKHTDIPDTQIIEMLLQTMIGTGNLMLEKGFSFGDVVTRVATKGGITEEGTKVVYDKFPDVADELFRNTLEKRKQTNQKAQEMFQ